MVHSQVSCQYNQVYHKVQSLDLCFFYFTLMILPKTPPLRFADDCILYRQIRTPDDCTTLQPDIDKLHHWSHTWQMAFNAKKCYTMAISRKRERPSLQYKLGDVQLYVVESFTYLGVTIPSDLRKHADHRRDVFGNIINVK